MKKMSIVLVFLLGLFIFSGCTTEGEERKPVPLIDDEKYGNTYEYEHAYGDLPEDIEAAEEAGSWWIGWARSSGETSRLHEKDIGSIKYAYGNGENWNIRTVDTDMQKSNEDHQGVKIDLNSEDIPHIVYHNQNKGAMLMATPDQDNWSYREIATPGYPALTIDELDRLHVAYTHGGYEDREMSEEVVEREGGEFEYIMYTLVEF